jgi:hypothetical protein
MTRFLKLYRFLHEFPLHLARELSSLLYIVKRYIDIQIKINKAFIGFSPPIKISFYNKTKDLEPSCNLTDTAILFQGPFLVFEHYAINTLQLYRRNYPDTPIIYSTWENEINQRHESMLRNLNVKVLVSSYPEERSSNSNADLMIHSMQRGIQYIRSNPNIKYICKHRGDQRINQWNWIQALKQLIDLIPPTAGSGENIDRIITTSTASGKLRAFHIGDQFQFGKTDDICRLWVIPLFTKGYKQLLKSYPDIIRQQNKINQGLNGENYIASMYSLKVYRTMSLTYEIYSKLLADLFIVIDDELILYSSIPKILAFMH